MYTRLSNSSLMVMRLANRDANRLGSKFIEPEHILAAMARVNAAPEIFDRLGVTSEQVLHVARELLEGNATAIEDD